MPPKQDIHHVSFHFGKSKVLFSVPGTTTLAQLKLTLLSALPHLYPSPNSSSSLPGLDPEDLAALNIPSSSSTNPDLPSNVRYTREFCLWKARTGEDGDLLSYVSLEGEVDDFDPLENMPGGGGMAGGSVKGNGKGKGKATAVDDADADADSYAGEGNGEGGGIGTGGGGGHETGDRKTALSKRINALTNPVWERWVEVYVSFVEPDGTFEPPKIDKPALFDEEQDQDQAQEQGDVQNGGVGATGGSGVLT